METPQNAAQKDYSKRVDHDRVENENTGLPPPIMFLRSEENVAWLSRIIPLFHLGIGKHVGDFAILE